MVNQKDGPKITTTVLRRIQELVLAPDNQVDISEGTIRFGERYFSHNRNRSRDVAHRIINCQISGMLIENYDKKYTFVLEVYKRLKELKALCKRHGITMASSFTNGPDAVIFSTNGRLVLQLTSTFAIYARDTNEIFEKDMLWYSRIVIQHNKWLEKSPLLQPYEYYDINSIAEPVD